MTSKDFLKLMDLKNILDVDLNIRELRKTFSGSLMIVEDDNLISHRALSFVDFCECLCRISHDSLMKINPDESVGYEDYMRKLGEIIFKCFVDSEASIAMK